MSNATAAMRELPGAFGSNFDHAIEADTVAALLAEPEACWASYPGWNFHGRVWATKDGRWACEVWRHCAPRDVIHAETPEALMDAVSNEWGRA